MAFARFEPELVALAREQPVEFVAACGRYWLERLDAEREFERAEAARLAEATRADGPHDAPGPAAADQASYGDEKTAADGPPLAVFDELVADGASWVQLSQTLDGIWILDGRLVPEDGAQLQVALDREIDRLHSEGDRRRRSERRGEALASIIRRDSAAPVNAGTNTPHISIAVDLAVWAGEKVGPLVTDHGARLGIDTVRRLACNAVIHIVTHDGHRVPLDLFRSTRTFNRAQRRALAVRDGGCRFPGCSRPPARTEAHHLVWWEVGGPTNLDNGVLLCHYHHRLVHEGHWRIQRDGADLVWFRPDGSRAGVSRPAAPTPRIEPPRPAVRC